MELLSVKEVAKRLHISHWTVLKMIKVSVLPAAKVGLQGKTSPYRITEDALDEYLQRIGLHRLPLEEPPYE